VEKAWRNGGAQRGEAETGARCVSLCAAYQAAKTHQQRRWREGRLRRERKEKSEISNGWLSSLVRENIGGGVEEARRRVTKMYEEER